MLRIVLINELRKAQRARHACGPAANDDHVGGHLRAFDAFERFAKNEHLHCNRQSFLAAGE